MFQLQTVLTTRCNFNCRYCYMRVNKAGNHESDLTVEDFIKMEVFLPDVQDAIGYQNNVDPNYDVAFFGGEPLLCLNSLLDIAKYIRRRYRSILCTVPTNGTLLDEKTEKLLSDAYVMYSISYDGPYSNQRLGSKTPPEFLLGLMQKRGAKAMVSPSNVGQLYDNFMFFIKNGIHTPAISIVRDNIWDDSSLDVLRYQLDKMKDFVISSLRDRDEFYMPQIFSLPILDTILSTHYGHRNPTCCFAGTSGVAFFADGDIYPCARFGANKRFKLGNYKKRQINKQNVSFLRSVSDIRNNEDCKECALRTVCNMGCFYSQLSFGKWKQNRAITNVCKAFKIIYDYAYSLYNDIGDNKIYSKYMIDRINNLG